MLSGQLNPEMLSQALRDVSQRRRQGVIEVILGDERLEVLFVQGRIVDVVRTGQRPVDEIYQRLVKAGLAAAGLKFEGGASAYSELLAEIHARAPGARALDAKFFKLALKERVLSELYTLWSGREGFFTFHARMVEGERELLPSISVGQLLLDVVAVEPAAQKYMSLVPEDAVLEKGAGPSQALGPEEEALILIMGERCSLSELENASFLSAYHRHEALTSLLERGVVACGPARPADRHGDVDALMAALEKTVDSVFEPLPEDSDDRQEAGARIPERSHARAELKAPLAEVVEASSGGGGDEEPLLEESPSGFGSEVLALNTSLLQSSWVPGIMTVLLIAGALLLPFVFWFEGLMKLADLNP